MEVTKVPITTETKLKRIAWLSKENANKQFNCLIHHYNDKSLKTCFKELDGKKAVGHDGINKEEYAKQLDENIADLLERMKRMAYKPGSTRQVLIPKADNPGATRGSVIYPEWITYTHRTLICQFYAQHNSSYLEAQLAYSHFGAAHDISNRF